VLWRSGGSFSLTGDTIKFGTDGLLKDGQNRLAAVVRSGVSLSTHTVFGIEPLLFDRMDIGKNRTGALRSNPACKLRTALHLC
jgi:hypothetical protein